MADIPAQHIAFLGEWTFINVTAPPPASQQLRLNDGGQNKATLIYVSTLTVNSIDATQYLMGLTPGCVIHLETKGDPTRWQNYTITGEPVTNAGYVQLTVTWLAGAANLAQTSVILNTVAVAVRATGGAMTVQTKAVTFTSRVSVYIASPMLEMKAQTNDLTDIRGQAISFDYAYPFEGRNLASPGMTLRQFYASQAMMGFIAAAPPAANLVGALANFSFQVADSMIHYERAEKAGFKHPMAGSKPRRVV